MRKPLSHSPSASVSEHISHNIQRLDRIILHLDMDCFYCQVESVRLSLPPTVPLAVLQWDTVIAVNYAARAAGVQRHYSYRDSIVKCPEMRFVHVPTYSIRSPGVLTVYSDTGKDDTRSPDRTTNKASLQPYREASTKVLSIIRKVLNSYKTGFVMERASIDEVFLDISDIVDAQMTVKYGIKVVHGKLEVDREQFQLKEWNLNWEECGNPAVSATIPSCESEKVDDGDDKDQDSASPSSSLPDRITELRIYLGSIIALHLRREIYYHLNYSVSAGIATNKTLAKLASAKYKPDQQTYVLPSMIKSWMTQVPLRKIRFLGGKLGKALLNSLADQHEDIKDQEQQLSEAEDKDEALDQESDHHPQLADEKSTKASELWVLSLEDLKEKLGNADSARWAYNVVRGIDSTPVAPRVQTKSFMSAKELCPPVKELTILSDWCLLLLTELTCRLTEEYQTNYRWPQSLTIYFKSPHEKSKSRTLDLPFGPDLLPKRCETMNELILNVLVAENKQPPVFPCSRLAISATRFKQLAEFNGKRSLTMDTFLQPGKPIFSPGKERKIVITKNLQSTRDIRSFFEKNSKNHSDNKANRDVDSSTTLYKCPKCKVRIPENCLRDIQEHQDFHFATELQYKHTA